MNAAPISTDITLKTAAGAPSMTESYLARPVDQRMVDIIASRFVGTGSVIDVACGSGLYGKHLAKRFRSVFAVDYDAALCAAAEATTDYDKVFCARVDQLSSYLPRVDAIFCSEFIEHVANESLRDVVGELEAVAHEEIVITVPNPLSPHFKEDPTHILKYNVRSLRTMLNQSTKFAYKLHPLGFSQYNLTKAVYRGLNPLAKQFALLSPTVLYIGTRK